jgi:serine/threonine protein kinase
MEVPPRESNEAVEKHVLAKFELCQRLGKSAFGVVWKVIEKKTRRVMALKKCYDAFRSSEDGQATYREIMYLTELSGHDNIVRLIQVVSFIATSQISISHLPRSMNTHRGRHRSVSQRR